MNKIWEWFKRSARLLILAFVEPVFADINVNIQTAGYLQSEFEQVSYLTSITNNSDLSSLSVSINSNIAVIPVSPVILNQNVSFGEKFSIDLSSASIFQSTGTFNFGDTEQFSSDYFSYESNFLIEVEDTNELGVIPLFCFISPMSNRNLNNQCEG